MFSLTRLAYDVLRPRPPTSSSVHPQELTFPSRSLEKRIVSLVVAPVDIFSGFSEPEHPIWITKRTAMTTDETIIRIFDALISTSQTVKYNHLPARTYLADMDCNTLNLVNASIRDLKYNIDRSSGTNLSPFPFSSFHLNIYYGYLNRKL